MKKRGRNPDGLQPRIHLCSIKRSLLDSHLEAKVKP